MWSVAVRPRLLLTIPVPHVCSQKRAGFLITVPDSSFLSWLSRDVVRFVLLPLIVGEEVSEKQFEKLLHTARVEQGLPKSKNKKQPVQQKKSRSNAKPT